MLGCFAPANPKMKFCTQLGAESTGFVAGVLVLFGMGIHSSRQSFPRKRESSPTTAHFERFAEWIPAFAGMTALQMTPAPVPLLRLTSSCHHIVLAMVQSSQKTLDYTQVDI
jgi:hypothetical protein